MTKEEDGVNSSTRALSRKNRVFVFRDFLLETYGEYLDKNSTILDVAGGKGDLSWLLVNVDRIDSVVVDPRVTKQIHLTRSVEYLRQHPEETQRRSIPHLPTYQPLATLLPKFENIQKFSKPRHLRLLLDQDLVNAVSEYLASESWESWKLFWSRASEKALERQTLGYEESADCSVNQVNDAVVALNTILQTRLIVGFHPDQATEACVDLASLLSIPFCIVPCCVFPSEFPQRENQDGTRVRTYQQLIEYLSRKCEGVRRADLNFPFTETAKNRVLFTLPGDTNKRNKR